MVVSLIVFVSERNLNLWSLLFLLSIINSTLYNSFIKKILISGLSGWIKEVKEEKKIYYNA